MSSISAPNPATEFQIPTWVDFQRFVQAVTDRWDEGIIAELKKFGPNIANYPVNHEGLMALHFADMFNIATCSALLAYGADPNARVMGSTPLMRAASSTLSRSVELISILGKSGADPNIRGGAGTTALIYAASDPKKVRALLDIGADPFLQNVNGVTALDCTRGVAESEQLLHDAMQNNVQAETVAHQQLLQRIPKSTLKKKMR